MRATCLQSDDEPTGASLSVALLAVIALLLAVPPLVRWQSESADAPRPRPHQRLMVELLQRYFGTLPEVNRQRVASEMAQSLDVELEIVSRANRTGTDSLATDVTLRREAGWSRERPFGRLLLVGIPGSDQVVRVGPPPPAPGLWAAFVALGIVAVVAAAGFLLALPLVRRLSRLRAHGQSHRNGRTRRACRSPRRRCNRRGSAVVFNQMAERNQALVERQRNLMCGVSHELRTPVARIRFSLELARESRDQSDRQRHFAAIDSDLGEVDELIKELLFVDGLNDQSALLAAQPFSVLSVIRDEVQRQRSSHPHVEVSMVSDLDDPFEVIGTERLFRRVIRNLLSNGFRHAKRRVRIAIAGQSGTVRVSIEDDGPGIPLLERAHILEPFVRLDPSRSRELGGVGLGLTIVDQILRAVGGHLTIGEATSGGASFTVVWPADVRSV